ncbi:MAG: hypothetical protein ACR2P9_04710 [Gammaproteobacteria bacterium]
MLKAILVVTILVLDLGPVERAYQTELDYSVVERGRISDTLAESWDADRLGGRRYILMQPTSREPVYLRFIRDPAGRHYQAMQTEGWNAVEILVQDPDALAQKLATSKYFSIVGPPRYLTEKKNIKAMQLIGPANELLYLTRIASPEKSGFGLQGARSYVDRVFIMVVGARDFAGLTTFYREQLAMPVTDPLLYRIGVLSDAHGLEPETKHQIAIARISDRFLVELDQYPDSAAPAVTTSGELPAGVAMVSFIVDEFAPGLPFLRAPRRHQVQPYAGRSAATLIGPAGEYIELVKSE